MYKLIAVDLDDTLLTDDLVVSNRNRYAIKKAQEKGIIFTIATGRVTKSAVRVAKDVGINVPIITFQGATVYDYNKEESVFENYLEIKKVTEILKYSQSNNVHCNIYDNNSIYVREENKWSDYYKTLSKGSDLKAVGDLTQFELNATPKMILIDEVCNIPKIRKDIEKLNIDNINIFTSKPNFLEITCKSASKGQALANFAKLYNIEQKDIIAIGDSFNDLSMIEYAGLGVCMENGYDEIKDIANYITLSNNNDGVANVIEKFIL